MFHHNHYNKNLKNFSRSNRKNSTRGERILWSRLRSKQVLNLRFFRQRSISKYIVDFFQPDKKVVIEIDGSSHDESKYPYDVKRQKELEALEYKILRYSEFAIVRSIDVVMEDIYKHLS